MEHNHNIENDPETVADNLAHPDHETNTEAKERQPFMPIFGSIIAAMVLFGLLALFLGWI